MLNAVIVGCGGRGQIFAEYAKKSPKEMKVVAIAEKRDFLREKMKKEYGIEDQYIFSDYKELFSKGKIGDVIFIATQDNQHIEPALMALDAGYKNLMVEKPIDRDLQKCVMLSKKADECGAKLQICHSLRFSPFYRKMKELIDSGVIGEIKHINQEEGVGYYHYVHSFVRGDWANEDESSPMILAKCCHDMDLMLYLLDAHAKEVSSYGKEGFFSEENAPKNSADRCIDCKVRNTCDFDAIKIYMSHLDFFSSAVYKEGFSNLEDAMVNGRYGRCAYRCNNNVVDHQSVNILFEGGITGTLTMTAFSKENDRETRIFGTKGEIVGDFDENVIYVKPFLSDIKTYKAEVIESGHGGADTVTVADFLAAARDEKEMCTPISVSIESHAMCEATEVSRKTGKSIKISDML
ncbi:MAG: Gfo/Idh/MocA family oxidoreductase [Clostridia bacterium]|nr:Gfo/Idh/MocA family oxidoreductase [Clostridia bacterium]